MEGFQKIEVVAVNSSLERQYYQLDSRATSGSFRTIPSRNFMIEIL